jgi:hypothetical protein
MTYKQALGICGTLAIFVAGQYYDSETGLYMQDYEGSVWDQGSQSVWDTWFDRNGDRNFGDCNHIN